MQEIALTGRKEGLGRARIGSEVVSFSNEKETIYVVPLKDEVAVVTARGKYILKKHPTQNYFHGFLGEHKAHVILQKITGRIIYWVKEKEA